MVSAGSGDSRVPVGVDVAGWQGAGAIEQSSDRVELIGVVFGFGVEQQVSAASLGCSPELGTGRERRR